METDPTRRFSVRVDDYVRCRPGYPREILPLLERECGLTPAARIADIGSGTGLLARLFLEYGCEVWGVEPNREMRQAAERLLAGEERFRSVEGRAEATGLPDGSVDLVSAGQAFHWFEPRGTRREFARILQPGGCVVLVWNERTNEPGFMRDYGALVQRYGPERPAIADAALDGFFGAGKWRMARFENRQEFDLDGLRGRLKSSSYAPLPGSEKYAPMMAELDLIFGKYARGGAVAFRYDTNVYVGQASQPVPRRP